MEFNEEELNKILAGQEDDAGKKAKAILDLYNENVNGIKMNRDDFKKEKEALKAKLDESVAANSKAAEDLKKLQEQLASSSPEELQKAYKTQIGDMEKQYKGVISEKDVQLKGLQDELSNAKISEKCLKCERAFNSAASKYDIESSGRDLLLNMIIGDKGSNFTEREFSEGVQLINKDGKNIDSCLRDFLETDVGKKFLRNGSSGGGAPGSNAKSAASVTVNPFKKETLNLTQQSVLFKTNPELYQRLKAEAQNS